jgi:hypothetical protein
MTAHDLLKDQLDDAGYQLSKVLEGIPEEAMEFRATPGSMNAREQIPHLMEAYQAYIDQCAGRKYEWGTLRPKSTETKALIDEFAGQRSKAVDTALSTDSEEAIKGAHMYVLGHDYYHVGQLCQARLAVQPDWNSYAIYRE